MRARHLMTTDIVCAEPEMDVQQAAEMMLQHRVSGLPVRDAAGAVVGIVTEADLFRRHETGTERHYSWWLEMFTSRRQLSDAYAKAHGGLVRDAMVSDVVTVTEDATLAEIADLLDQHRIKRVPVMRGEALVGIVSRSDLLRALVGAWLPKRAKTTNDRALRHDILAAIRHAPWVVERRSSPSSSRPARSSSGAQWTTMPIDARCGPRLKTYLASMPSPTSSAWYRPGSSEACREPMVRQGRACPVPTRPTRQ